MAISLPSNRIAVVDCPEVNEFSAKFVYNFFTVDEGKNDSGTTLPDFIENRAAVDFDAKFLDSVNFKRFTPRYVKFSWKALSVGNRPELVNAVSIAKNLKKIHNEQTFITDEYTNVFFQDTQRENKLMYFVRRAIEELGNNNVFIAHNSPQDFARYINANSSKIVEENFLSEAITNYDSYGYKFVDKENEERVLTTLNGVNVRVQLNNKLLATLLKTTTENTINVFDAGAIDKAERIQETARSTNPSTIVDGQNYDFEIYDIIDYKVVDPSSFNSTVQVVGYEIDKTEYNANGAIKKESIIVESNKASTTIDLKVKYGARYVYTIRSIVLVEMASEDKDTNSIIAVSFLVASRRSPKVIVDCVEKVAPPPVADFNVEWDYDQNAPRIRWSFPVNPQRDIKYFQIFRRPNISSPFELLKMYDFNDSLTPTALNEIPDLDLIVRLKSPLNCYIDKEFTKDSVCIYTICSVDAHGFFSNYGIQLQCSFDKHKNKLVKKLVSLSGAPKAYPNFLLQRDTFVDTIKTSGAKSLRIIFNPEYHKIKDRFGNDLKLLKTGENDVYKLQMINVDLQRQHTIDITLKDRRPLVKK